MHCEKVNTDVNAFLSRLCQHNMFDLWISGMSTPLSKSFINAMTNGSAIWEMQIQTCMEAEFPPSLNVLLKPWPTWDAKLEHEIWPCFRNEFHNAIHNKKWPADCFIWSMQQIQKGSMVCSVKWMCNNEWSSFFSKTAQCTPSSGVPCLYHSPVNLKTPLLAWLWWGGTLLTDQSGNHGKAAPRCLLICNRWPFKTYS